MRYRVGKRLELLVQGGQLRRALNHFFFQLAVQTQNFVDGEPPLRHIALNSHPMGVPTGGVGDGRNVHFHPELLARLGVVHQLGAHGFPGLQGHANAVQFLAAGFRALQQFWRFSQHLFPGVTGAPLKRIVDIHNPRPRRNRLRFSDQNNVVDAGNRCGQQFKLRMFCAPLRHIPEVHGQTFVGGVDAGAQPQAWRGVKSFEVPGLAGLQRFTILQRSRWVQPVCKLLPQGAAQQLTTGSLQQLFSMGVDIGKAPLAVQGHQAVADGLQRGRQAVGQRQLPGFSLLLLRNILHRTLHAGDVAGSVTHRLAGGSHPDSMPAGGDDFKVGLKRLTGGHAALEQLANGGLVLGRVKRNGVPNIQRAVGDLLVNGVGLVRPGQRHGRQLDLPGAHTADLGRHVQQCLDAVQLRVRVVAALERGVQVSFNSVTPCIDCSQPFGRFLHCCGQLVRVIACAAQRHVASVVKPGKIHDLLPQLPGGHHH